MYLPNILKVLGDKTRLRILNLLTAQELCVCLIEGTLGITQPNASKHLRRLHHSGIICCKKISHWCFYRINTDFEDQYDELMTLLIKHWQKNKPYVEDIKKLEYLLETNDCCKKLLRNHNIKEKY